MRAILDTFDASILATVLSVLMLAAWAAGLRMGRAMKARQVAARWSKFDDGSLAILGLLIAFSFGISMSRHDDRRIMVVHDSNAIGDFYTCATLLDEPVRSQLQHVIRDYTALRLKVAREGNLDQAGLEVLLKQFQEMHDQMTALVGQALHQGTPIAVPLTMTLNNLISTQALRIGAVENHLQPTVAMLLFISAIVATMLVGREQGFEDKSEVPATLSFILIVALAVYVTLDLNQPQRGIERISQAPMQRLLSSMTPPSK